MKKSLILLKVIFMNLSNVLQLAITILLMSSIVGIFILIFGEDATGYIFLFLVGIFAIEGSIKPFKKWIQVVKEDYQQGIKENKR